MRNVLLSLTLFLSVVSGLAQTAINPASQIRWPAITGTANPTAPAWPCTVLTYGQPYTNTTTGVSFVCTSLGWVSATAAAAAPTSGVQFNNGGVFDADSTLTFDSTNKILYFPAATGTASNAGLNTTGNVSRTAYPFSCNWNDQPLRLGGTVSHTCLGLTHTYSSPGVYAGSPWSLTAGIYLSSLVTGRSISQGFASNFQFYKGGDSAGFYFYNHNRGAVIATSDEGNAGGNVQMFEDPPPSGTITTGGASATYITPSFTVNNGNQGDVMPLVSTSEVMSSGSLLSETGTSGTPFTITTSDTHSVSTGIGVLASSCGTLTTRNQPITSTCTVTLTSGSFATTAKMCVGDAYPETVAVSAVGTVGSTQTVTAGFTYVHPAGTIVEQGGMCGGKLALGNGYANPSTANGGYMTSYYVVGSRAATSLDVVNVYKGGQNGPQAIHIPGVTAPYSVSFTGMTRTSNVVTAAVSGAYQQWPNYYVAPPLASMQITGASDSSFNGVITTTTVNDNLITWPQTAANSTATGGTLSIVGLNNYVVYCGAETVAVLPTQLQVEPNDCSWPTGGTIVQPNFYSQADGVLGISGNGTTPSAGLGLAVSLAGHKYAGGQYMLFTSSDPITNYVGYGGQDNPLKLITTNAQNPPYLSNWISLPAPMDQGCVFCIGRIPYDATHVAPVSNYNIFQIQNRDNSFFVTQYDEVSKIMTFENIGGTFSSGTIGGVGSNVNINNVNPNMTGNYFIWNLTGDNELLKRNTANTGLTVTANAGDKFTVFDSALGQSIGSTGYLGKIDATTTVGTGSAVICQSNGTNCSTVLASTATATTQATTDSSTLVATDAFVHNVVTAEITQGTATLAAGTVTVSTTAAVAVAGGHYQVSNCGAAGTPGVLSIGASPVVGTSFVINSTSATDTSTVCWWIR